MMVLSVTAVLLLSLSFSKSAAALLRPPGWLSG